MKIGNIKFKAKRLDNGEWVKGDLAHSLDGGLNIFGFTREYTIFQKKPYTEENRFYLTL